MNVPELAYELAKFVLKTAVLDIDVLRSEYTPFTRGALTNGFIAPSDVVCSSANAAEYINHLLLSENGIPDWIELMRWMRDDLQFDLTSDVNFEGFGILCRFYDIVPASYPIPMMQLRGDHLGATKASVRSVTYSEYMNIYGFLTLNHVFNHIIQIVLFGFPLTTELICDGMKLHDDAAYMASRLFQGKADFLTMMILQTYDPVSIFLDEELDEAPNFGPSLSALTMKMELSKSMDGTKRSKLDFSTQITSIRNQVIHGHYSGFDSEILLAIHRTGLYSLDDAYVQYLSNEGLFPKVSFSLWKKMVFAGTSQGPMSNQESDYFHGDGMGSTANYTQKSINPFIAF